MTAVQTPAYGRYLTEAEASEFTRFARGTLRNMRSAGVGPDYIRIGGSIRYRLADLIDWMECGDGPTAA